MKRIIIALILAGLFAGCAGTPFSFDQARQVKVGMTQQQVEGIMGRPYLVKSQPGREIWVYSYANAFSGEKMVSFVFVGGKLTSAPDIPASYK